VQVPLVLHGATSIDRDDLRAAIALGIRKVNVGSALKQAFFDAVRRACLRQDDPYNPYEVIGSGLEADILVQGRLAMQDVVEAYLRLFGSAGKAGSPEKKTGPPSPRSDATPATSFPADHGVANRPTGG
jgi:fructose/tagatose bisphosphate aldolase